MTQQELPRRSPLDKLLERQPVFAASAIAFQPSFLRMTAEGAMIDAQTLPLNDSDTVSALLKQNNFPTYVSPLIIEPDLVPPSPPPPMSPPPPVRHCTSS